MRVFLRSTRTGKYIGELEEWTDGSNDAKDFTQIDHAISAACHKRLDHVEVVLVPDQSEREITLAIR